VIEPSKRSIITEHDTCHHTSVGQIVARGSSKQEGDLSNSRKEQGLARKKHEEKSEDFSLPGNTVDMRRIVAHGRIR
jgi:hypothetical protein